CEYRTNPLGIDVIQPRLSWLLESDQRGQRQTAYQALVASSLEQLGDDRGDLWDSGKIESDQSAHVVYAGAGLQSGACCWWKVRVWDKEGQPSDYSAPAWWELGLLAREDWSAQWIGAPPAGGRPTTTPRPFTGHT